MLSTEIIEPRGSLSEIDFFSREVIGRPLGFLDRARKESPVVKVPTSDTQRVQYLVTTYDLVKQVLTNPDLFSSDYSAILKGHEKDDPAVEAIKKQGFKEIHSVLTSDGADHTRMRGLVLKAFTAEKIQSMETSFHQVVAELLDHFQHKGQCDFSNEFANQLPANVLAALLGEGKDKHDDFLRWSHAIARRFGQLMDLENRITDEKIILEAKQYMEQLVKDRRLSPKNDLVSDLIAARDEDENRLSELELLANIFIMFTGATETTTSALIYSMAHLAEDQELQTQLRAQPENIPLFIDEILRFYTPVAGVWRVVRQDLELGGVSMKKGDVIMVRFDSANRDPSQFDNPDTFDIFRKNNSRHVSFSSGPHMCVGFRLARMEMTLALNAILSRLKNIRIDEKLSDLDIQPSTHARCLKDLHIQFEARQAN